MTILQLLFFAGTVADRSEWLARCTASFILYLGQLQHTIPPTTISVVTETPSFFFRSSLFMMQYYAIFLLKKSLKNLFRCIFLKWQKLRLETETENGQAGNDPPVRGAFPGVVFLSASHSYTAITFECVTMISTSRYA